MHRFVRNTSALLIVDVQERLIAAMNPARVERLVNRTLAAIDGAKALGMPIIVTEQYPKGLGPTMKAVAERIPDFKPVEKLQFSAWLPEVKDHLGARTSVLVLGAETHVCVLQTVRALSEAGLTPYLAADAVLSRNETDERVGLELCRAAGAVITTVETALFDALVRAGGPEFKAVSAAVK